MSTRRTSGRTRFGWLRLPVGCDAWEVRAGAGAHRPCARGGGVRRRNQPAAGAQIHRACVRPAGGGDRRGVGADPGPDGCLAGARRDGDGPAAAARALRHPARAAVAGAVPAARLLRHVSELDTVNRRRAAHRAQRRPRGDAGRWQGGLLLRLAGRTAVGNVSISSSCHASCSGTTGPAR
jgi:hypothetical protein